MTRLVQLRVSPGGSASLSYRAYELTYITQNTPLPRSIPRITATTNTFSVLPSTATATVFDPQTVEVQTFSPNGSHVDEDFSLAIFC